jgi:hypothetical protein
MGLRKFISEIAQVASRFRKLLHVGISSNPIIAQSQSHTPKPVLVSADDENI